MRLKLKKGRQKATRYLGHLFRAIDDFILNSVASCQGTMSPFASRYPDLEVSTPVPKVNWSSQEGETEMPKRGRQKATRYLGHSLRAIDNFIFNSVASGQGTMSPFGSLYPDWEVSVARNCRNSGLGNSPAVEPSREVLNAPAAFPHRAEFCQSSPA